jgi:hypothetical protein
MTPLKRAGAFVASATLAVSGLTLVAPAANAATDTRPETIGATWLVGQLTNGLFHYPDTGFGAYDDYGLSIDAGMSLLSVGGHATDVHTIDAALATNIDKYVTGDAFGDTGSLYAGATAKAAYFAEQAYDADNTNASPISFGGHSLFSDLDSRVSETAPIAGRIEDLSPVFQTDYANTIGQAFAVGVLNTLSSVKSADAQAFLLKQQCSAGYFRLNFTPDKTAADQTCDGGIAAGQSAPDPDATATALRMLAPEIGSSATVARAIGKAEGWLMAQQHADGSFGGGTSTSSSNTNSTALAGWALGLLGDTDAASRAAAWVRGRQADEVAGCSDALGTQTGAMGYNDAAVAAGLKAGITTATTDQWRRASAQGLAVLQWAPAAAPLVLHTPGGYVQARTSVAYGVSGTPGDKVCLTGSGSPVRGVIGSGGTGVVRAVAPAGTAVRHLTLTDRAGDIAQAPVSVLGAATFAVHPASATPVRGSLLRIRVTGLAGHESVVVKFRGVQRRIGVATQAGTYVTTFRVGQVLGRGTVLVLGQFGSIRRGSATVTVVR